MLATLYSEDILGWFNNVILSGGLFWVYCDLKLLINCGKYEYLAFVNLHIKTEPRVVLQLHIEKVSSSYFGCTYDHKAMQFYKAQTRYVFNKFSGRNWAKLFKSCWCLNSSNIWTRRFPQLILVLFFHLCFKLYYNWNLTLDFCCLHFCQVF